jgi:hypothetical protein
VHVACLHFTGGFGTLSELWLKDKTPENCLSSVEIYDPETNSWTMGPPLPVALCAMGVVKYYGTIYILGTYLTIMSTFIKLHSSLLTSLSRHSLVVMQDAH